MVGKGERAEDSPIGVGVIGANPDRGWGSWAHLPALAAMSQFELVAVATTQMKTAKASAEKYGAKAYFDNPEELIVHPGVELVSVTVKVRHHAELVRAALEAGKHVYCEWPLALDLETASLLAALAEEKGVCAMVGLQGMRSPGTRFVAELINDGTIGRPLAVSVIASSASSGRRTPQARVYSLTTSGGDTALTVATAHVLSVLSAAVGPITSVSGLVRAVNGETVVVETGETLPVDAPDQVVVCGEFAAGAVLSVAVQGCLAPAALGFQLRVVGTDATLLARSAVPGALHIVDWEVKLAREDESVTELQIPERLSVAADIVPGGRPRNVALMYQEIAQAIRDGRPPVPSFATAVALHGLLGAVQASSDTGLRLEAQPLL